MLPSPSVLLSLNCPGGDLTDAQSAPITRAPDCKARANRNLNMTYPTHSITQFTYHVYRVCAWLIRNNRLMKCPSFTDKRPK